MTAASRSPGRIFINYRRDDTGGTAGRLSDSLAHYFGPRRVFRDVDDIDAGANFETVLQRTAKDADAMIVLIGRQWARITDDRGQVRLHHAQDWVALEIAAALERGIPVYPVLVESAVMPRDDELPEALKPLSRHNAISLSDHRWATDVMRLARIVAIDIPGSLAERTLITVQWVVSLALALAITLPAVLVAIDQGLGLCGSHQLYTRALSGMPSIVVLSCAATLLFYARLVDPAQRRWVHRAVAVGLAGTLVAWLWVGFGLTTPNGEGEGIEHPAVRWVALGCSSVTATLMLVLMSFSRFKAR